MRKFQRLASPSFLSEKWEQWGRDWEDRRSTNPRATFHWHGIDGEPVNQKLLPTLKAQVQGHCSFCDHFPVCPPSTDTIEHFRPKTRFPREAFQWENLFYCCNHCQKKGERYDDALLRPDGSDYVFDRFFIYDFTTGRIEPNPLASPVDQNRALITIDLYLLNEGHPSLRKRELRERAARPADSLDDFAYRDFVGSLSCM
ncbi:MAG TPA: retron system putative HNH endonuclease [Verrucomicrobiae bacterium]|nr:retron system putative HNH endonuclease [Verrucomicrobiae bacterium]